MSETIEVYCDCGESYTIDDPGDIEWAECPNCGTTPFFAQTIWDKDSEIARLQAENEQLRNELAKATQEGEK